MWYTTGIAVVFLARTFSTFVLATTTDICASLINTPLKYSNGVGTTTIGIISQSCLCVSDVPHFVTTNVVAEALVAVAGVSAAQAEIISLIETASSARTCTYPDEAEAQCTPSNFCAFTCNNGYSVSGSSCVCGFPNVICNGVCQSSSLCPSSVPPAKRESRSRSPRCKFGWTACGVPGGAPWSYDCVDTHTDLESCGGCTTPLTKYSPIGTDCSSLPGVEDVSCNRGSCLVLRCQTGYTLSADHSSCLRKDIKHLTDHVMEFQPSGKFWKGGEVSI